MDIAGRKDAPLLGVLGLDDLEERTYRRLVALPSESADALAASAGVDVAAILVVVEALEHKGLVARSMTTPGHFVAAPPGVALGSLIVQRQEDIRRAELELAALAEVYRGAVAEKTEGDVLEVVQGRQAVAQRFGQLQRGATREVLALVKSTVAVVSADENVDEDVAIARGVSYRVVLERAAFDVPGFYDKAAESVKAGEMVRVADSVPLRLVIADRQLALLPLHPAGDDLGGGALLVHRSGLLDALLVLFDFVWRQASPVVAGRDGLGAPDIDDMDAQVLTLLLAGLTDQAIGRQLGMSLRTVQRRVHQLMDLAGAGTRFQLGHVASACGWLPSSG
jgi:sugar-specific transcriptional regulator TrmB/DNA-binding CsgD family transcriptional regulator